MRAQDLLPDDQDEVICAGVTVRKGSVAAFLTHARVWSDAGTAPLQRELAERHMVEGLAGLRAVGLFELLEPRDPALRHWLAEH